MFRHNYLDSELLIRDDVAGNVYTGFNHHLEGSFDDALAFPVLAIFLDRNGPKSFDLGCIFLQFSQFFKIKVSSTMIEAPSQDC